MSLVMTENINVEISHKMQCYILEYHVAMRTMNVKKYFSYSINQPI